MWTIRLARADEQPRLHAIWRDAVRATHGFLAQEHFELFSRLVRDEILPLAGLWVAADAADRAAGWMQLAEGRLEALFVDPACHGKGAGRALVEHALAISPALALDVNAQGSAVGFYRRLGFVETGRSEVDAMGLPYPLVHMRGGRAAQPDSASRR